MKESNESLKDNLDKARWAVKVVPLILEQFGEDMGAHLGCLLQATLEAGYDDGFKGGLAVATRRLDDLEGEILGFLAKVVNVDEKEREHLEMCIDGSFQNIREKIKYED